MKGKAMHYLKRLSVAVGFIALLFSSHPALANHPIPEEVCVEVACRPATEVILALGQGEMGRINVATNPYVYEGVVSIIAGETIHVEATSLGGTLTDLRFVTAVANEERTITLKFEQRIGIGMLLTVTHPFSKPMKYSAGIHRPGYEEFHQTSICPVPREGGSWEHWPEPLVQLLLYDFRFVDENDPDAMICN